MLPTSNARAYMYANPNEKLTKQKATTISKTMSKFYKKTMVSNSNSNSEFQDDKGKYDASIGEPTDINVKKDTKVKINNSATECENLTHYPLEVQSLLHKNILQNLLLLPQSLPYAFQFHLNGF